MHQPIRAIAGDALHGIRRCLGPGVALWALAALIVIAYGLPSFRPAFAQVEHWRSAHGLLFSVVTTALMAGLLPVLVLAATRRLRGPFRRELGFALAFWAWKGCELDLFYRAQTWLFGGDADWRTVLIKVLFDQFVFTPLWVTPTGTLAYRWKERLPWAGALRAMGVVLVSNWFVWIPTVTCMYLLPTPLQMPVCTCVLAFWALVLGLAAGGVSRR